MAMRTTLKLLDNTRAVGDLRGRWIRGRGELPDELGMKLHYRYEYCGGFFGKGFMTGCGIVGLIAPAILVWHLDKNSWRVSLRPLFIAMFIVAGILGVYALSL